MVRLLLRAIGTIGVAILAVGGILLALDGTALAQTNLPAPANVTAVNGDSPGEVVVSWDAVSGASGYSVRWVHHDSAWAVHRAGEDWRNLIQSADVAGGQTTTHTLTIDNRTAGEVQYGFGVGSKSDPATRPIWSAWQFLNVRGAGGLPVDGVSVLTAALEITKHASALVSTSVSTQRGMTPDDLRESAMAVAVRKAALNNQLEILTAAIYNDRVLSIEALVNRLLSNAEQINNGRPQLLRALAQGDQTIQQLTVTNSTALYPAAVTSVDNQFYRLVSDAQDGGAEEPSDVSKDQVLRYEHVTSLSSNLALAHTLLLVASRLEDPTFVARSRESYDSVAGRIERDIAYLSGNGDPGLDARVIPLARQMLADGNQNFDRLEQRLGLIVAEKALIQNNAKALDYLMAHLSALAAEIQGMDAPPIAAMLDEPTAAPGVAGDEIRFGQSAALTGPSSALGKGMQLGIQAAFKEANDAGGVHGRQLTLMTRDDRYESDLAFAQTRALIEVDDVFALIGSVGTPTSRAASPLARAAGAPFIGPFTGAQLLRGPELDNVLNFRASYHEETEEMVARLAEAGITRVAVLYQNDSYGIDGLTGVRQALERRNMEPVASWYYRRNTQAVNSAVFRIAEANPEAVIIIGAYGPAARAIERLRAEVEPDPIFMAVSFVGSNALANELGASGEGVYVTQVVPLPGDSNSDVARYRAALAALDPQAEPGFVSLEGYLAGRLAITGLELCGSSVSRECFLNAVQNSRTINLAGIRLQFGPDDNQGSDSVFLTRLGSDGEYRRVNSVTDAP